MDCPTEPNITNSIDENTAKNWMGDRFDAQYFKLKLGNQETMTMEKFRLEVDCADVYFLSDPDNYSTVQEISKLLQGKGLITWLDPGNLELVRGIQGSQCVVVLITRDYISRICSNDASDRCKKAFNVAISKKRLGDLIPVVLDSSLEDSVFWGGEVGKTFAGRRNIDMSGDFTHSDYLADRVEHLSRYILSVISQPIRSRDTTNLTINSISSESKERRNLNQLSISEISTLLTRCKLSNYIEIFQQNEVDGFCLSVCKSEEEIKELGITLLPKARILFSLLQEFTAEGGVPLKLISKKLPLDDSQRPTESENNNGTQGNPGGVTSSSSASSNQGSSPSPPVVSRLQPIRVSGCSGERAHDINGIYDATEEMHDGFCRYLKRGGQNNWIEYNATRGHWHIKKAESKGTVNAWAYAVSPCVSPESIDPLCVWHVYNGFEFPEQPELQVARVYESIMVRGAVGTCAQQVNGIFDPTNEMCGGWIRYRKRGGQDSWIEYSEVRGQWHIKPSASKNTTNAWAYMVSKPVCSPEKQKGGSWHLYDGTKFDKQENVIVLPEAVPVCLKGATGSCMNQVNGIFDPTEEVYGGFVRYKKRGGQDCWMEYNEIRKQWHIKPEASKTTTNAWAYAVYPMPIPPHKRRAVWHLFDGSQFEKQVEVIVMPELKPVVISGASGNVAPQVNGIFDPTDELCNGWVRYRKRGGQDCWMEYMESKGQWHIKPSASKRSTNAWAYATCRPVQPPQEIGDIWRLYDGSRFEDHPNVTVTVEPDEESREMARWFREIQNSSDI